MDYTPVTTRRCTTKKRKMFFKKWCIFICGKLYFLVLTSAARYRFSDCDVERGGKEARIAGYRAYLGNQSGYFAELMRLCMVLMMRVETPAPSMFLTMRAG